MSWIAVGVMAVSVVTQMSAAGQAKKAAAQEAEANRRIAAQKKEAADFEANVLEVQAGQQVAAAQRDMLDVQRASRLAQSRAVALSAASGGGASSPTIVRLVGNLAKEGAYNAARALYSGEEKARIMQIQAYEKRKEGEYAIEAGELGATAAEMKGDAAQTKAIGGIIGSVGGLYGKYGGSGPSGGTTDFGGPISSGAFGIGGGY